MVGFGGTVVEATTQFAPIYWGLLGVLIVSVVGIAFVTPLPRQIRLRLALGRYRRFGGKGQPETVRQIPAQA